MKLNNEAKIGILIFIVLSMLAVLTIKTGKMNFSKKGYGVKVRFKTIDGVDLNVPVRLNGFEVGSVKNIDISYAGEDTIMELYLWLDEKAKLREGAKAYVKTMGFMGEKYVGLSSGNPGGAYLPAGSVIQGEPPVDLDKLLSDGQVIADNIKAISINVNERLQKNKEAIDNIIANFDITMKHAVSISDNLDERLTKNKENIDDILANLKSASVNLDALTYDLKLHPWKLMYRGKDVRAENVQAFEEKQKALGNKHP